MTTTTVTKEIGEYDTITRDYPAYVIIDGRREYIGSRKTQHGASLLASDYIIQFYTDNHTPETAAALIHEELAQEGRHEQAAKDQGMAWVTADDPYLAALDGRAPWPEATAPEEHTPGPWEWNRNRPGFYDLEWLDGANGERVLTLYGNGQSTPNKRLIGAAPDLLFVARALVAWESDDTQISIRDVVNQARAAIAKATSPSPGGA